jgi:hypothetical protein
VTVMSIPALSSGSSFVKTPWKQLNGLFVSRMTGHLDLLAHRADVANYSSMHQTTEQLFDWLDGLVPERRTVDPHTINIWKRPTRSEQSVFELKNIKLTPVECHLCVPATCLFPFFVVAAPALQVALAGEGLT